mmetsp:Transcript_78715/g.242871  ORF Transcript_78715/g.242871 Transcript_78715/m.242871 type:complete len:101 (+) Transcript_78715:317-619(+)
MEHVIMGPNLPFHIIQSCVLGPRRWGRNRNMSGSSKTLRAPLQSQVEHKVIARQSFSQHGTLTGVALGSYQIGGSTSRSVEKLRSMCNAMKDMEDCKRFA